MAISTLKTQLITNSKSQRQLKLITSFLPWIAFSVFISILSPVYTCMLAIVIYIVTSRQALIQKFILDWASLIFFILLGLLLWKLPEKHWLVIHAGTISSYALAAIMWLSILIGKPFTLQYAKQSVPAAVTKLKIFIWINYWISIMWGVLLSISAILGTLYFYFPRIFSNPLVTVLQISIIILATKLTSIMPSWLKTLYYKKAIKNAPPCDQTFLSRNFAPVKVERNTGSLEVIGEIPPELHGIYMRNGPNPKFEPISYTYPFDGDGMLHAINLENGRATYSNRWVNTLKLQVEEYYERAVYPGIKLGVSLPESMIPSTIDPIAKQKNGAYIHVAAINKTLLALAEANYAYEITSDLRTVGPWRHDGSELLKINAHMRTCHQTQEVFALSYDTIPAELMLYQFNATGKLQQRQRVALDYATMFHDFVITQNHLIVFITPFCFDFSGNASSIFSWKADAPTQVLIFARNDLTKAPQIFKTDPCFVYHFANAYEHERVIYIDYAHYQSYRIEHDIPAHLYRMTINLDQKTVKNTCLSATALEFCRINDCYSAQPYRYVYSLANKVGKQLPDAIAKYDLLTQTEQLYYAGKDYQLSEACFVSKTNSIEEDDGYLMLFAYHQPSDRSEFWIIDAHKFGAPIATIKLPCRVPVGLHGNWFTSS